MYLLRRNLMTTVSDLNIPPPNPDKPPLKTNVFSLAGTCNSALTPLFPYLLDGDLVPAVTLFYGGPGRGGGVFTHTNSVDEVVICFGVRGAAARAGDVIAGAREHVVRNTLDQPENVDSVMTLVVVQRQSERGVPQSEVVTYLCEKCQTPLLKHHFDAKVPTPEQTPPGYQPAFQTICQSVNSAEEFNANETIRTCAKCGHVTPPFPIRNWGWQNYRDGLEVTERSRDCYLSDVAARRGE
jgi:hypothetical protein